MLAATAAVAVIVFTGATIRLFLAPPTDAPRQVDAVVLFAGGRGERLDLAEELLVDGVAPNLVIPNGNAPEWPEGNAACTEERRYNVFCPDPDPDTTTGEARTIATLAERRGWDSVLLVTSTYHVSRASLLLGRCFGGEVLTAAASPDLALIDWASRVGVEWLAWTRSVLVDRSC